MDHSLILLFSELGFDATDEQFVGNSSSSWIICKNVAFQFKKW